MCGRPGRNAIRYIFSIAGMPDSQGSTGTMTAPKHDRPRTIAALDLSSESGNQPGTLRAPSRS